MSLRVFDTIAKGSIPVMLVYFIWFAPAGENSDVAVVRRWTEGFLGDVKDLFRLGDAELEIARREAVKNGGNVPVQR